MPFVIGCCQNYAEGDVPLVVLQLFDHRLPPRRELAEDQRLKLPPPQHRIQLGESLLVMAVHHKDSSAPLTATPVKQRPDGGRLLSLDTVLPAVAEREPRWTPKSGH